MSETDLDLVELAGVPIAFDRRWRWLEPLRSDVASGPADTAARSAATRLLEAAADAVAGETVEETAAEGWVGGSSRRVIVRFASLEAKAQGQTIQRLEIDVAEIGCVTVLLDTVLLDLEAPPRLEAEGLDGADPDHLAEAVLGPGLVLALAARGRWCLHAGAIALGSDPRAHVFLGESGAGKSTLAGHLSRSLGERHLATRLADDVLPIEPTDESGTHGARAWPTFPQLKLPPDEQPVVALGRDPVPLGAIYRLKPVEPDAEPAIAELSSSDATLALVRHTVAGRLFDAKTLRRHLDEASTLAAQIPVRELRVPRSLDRLGEITELLEPA